MQHKTGEELRWMRQLLRDVLTVALAASAVALITASIVLMAWWLSSLSVVFGAYLTASRGMVETPPRISEKPRRWNGVG